MTSAPFTTSPPTAPPTTGASGLDLRIYLMRGDHLGVAHRRVATTIAPARAAMTEVLAGPTAPDAAAGLSSTVPAGTRLLGLSIAQRIATVDLSGAFASGGGSLSMTARLAEVTFTLTQFPTVTGVAFHLDGRPVTVFGGEGIVLDHPATRASFEALAPPILVETPAPGDRIVSPFGVTGTANVFEATFEVQVTVAGGVVIADQVVTATSGTGTRGSFAVTVSFAGPAREGTVVVFDRSAKDGSRQDVVEIPVHLDAA